MTLVGFRLASSPGRHCLVLVIRRALVKTSGLSGSRWNEGAACWGSPPAVVRHIDGAQTNAQRGCAQCAHRPGLRIQLYQPRTGPDWRCFRGKGGFAGGGVRFESHLGHVFSLFRGLWAAERGQTVHMRAPSGAFFVGNRVVGPAHSLPARSTVWCLLPFHCRSGRGQHDLLKR